ncbi:hypothetical protein [Plesiocystis pacifica]|uniref:hypothetical protein n=1 Tax=Plesiocystis pacifica TaxID=191768 RepID=UPI0012F94E56|nr:hypothetical protein [Plesiocystis pacifica]
MLCSSAGSRTPWLEALLGGLLAAVVYLSPGSSLACDAPVGPITGSSAEHEFEWSTVVVRATVLSYDEPALATDWYGLPYPLNIVVWKTLRPRVSATLRVEEVWKGSVTREITIYSDDSSCGEGFRDLAPGDELLLFAYEDHGIELGPGREPVPIEHEWAQEALVWLGPGQTEVPRLMTGRVLRGLGVVFVLSLVPALVWRRRAAGATSKPD